MTYIGQFLVEARRARSVEETERRASEAEFRTAKRLTMDELETIHLHQRLILDEGRYPSNHDVIDKLMPTKDWETYRGLLARDLPDDQWAGLARVMHSVASQRSIVAGGTEEETVTEEVVQGLRDGAELTSAIYQEIVGRPPLTG